MKIRIWPKSRWTRRALVVFGVLVFVVLVPYLTSRIASLWRCVSVYSDSGFTFDEQQTPSKSLRIACYNIAHGRGLATSNWEGGDQQTRLERLEQVADLLREIDADIVVLNEVDFDASWSFSVNQAEYIARLAEYPYRVEQRNLDLQILGWTWKFGNAILSKHPITQAEVIQLPSYRHWERVLAGQKRGVICTINVPGENVRVIGTHLSHRSESVRVRSTVMLSELAAGSDVPTFLAGDLNSTPSRFPKTATDDNGQNAIDTLSELGQFQRFPLERPDTSDSFTYHSTEPRSVIDWILIPVDWNYVDYQVHPSTLSDHRLIFADITKHSD